jgi:hypothetical protein
MSGLYLIEQERRRQIDREGYTAEHDDMHANGELASAALAYLSAYSKADKAPKIWPWPSWQWNPKDRLSNLVRAGALFLAEEYRLHRARVPFGEVSSIRDAAIEVACKINELKKGDK